MVILRKCLLFSVLMFQVLRAEEIWLCTGELASLSYSDCSELGPQSIGCFYLEHFSQYRPCSQICNNIDRHSMKVNRCQDYCSEYLEQCCTSWDTAGSATSTRIRNPTTQITVSQPSSEADDSSGFYDVTIISVLSVGLAGTITVLAIVSIYVCIKKKRSHSRRRGGKMTMMVLGVEETAPNLDSPTYGECYAVSDIEGEQMEKFENLLNESGKY